jgi:hypothetical protein
VPLGSGVEIRDNQLVSDIWSFVPQNDLVYGYEVYKCHYHRRSRTVKEKHHTYGADFLAPSESSEIHKSNSEEEEEESQEKEIVECGVSEDSLGHENLGQDAKRFNVSKATDESTGDECTFLILRSRDQMSQDSMSM